MWQFNADWSPEEESASQGKFDPRPLLMIHFSEQSHPVAVTEPFDQISLHSILVSMLQGQIASASGFQSWLDHAGDHSHLAIGQGHS
jgi:hypothetical protein